ncbi:TIGR01459 family HAD-type hydrolase [Tranquillimonas alkanivorans]|uniref:HAD-superfamily class IIA hydrolase, TIGR01459 n=1 Tax=Tranquillimonas alkanivorans TaxID=441119 RepID=A0A1I5NCX7_9RHOB|nr:TIGR01459 family HAD-type hydrolase [Tranquillimonas alkanivorans]SFP19542.1 HAD-superfamily class IIA hydrolase, TIGR01459 [Tranquillimonas alkanivorans]
MARIIHALSEIAQDYDALFCDLWGCVHDGVRALPEAVAALQDYRANGGSVVLVTNAPRQRASVQRQIEELGVPADAWDSIATSGDAARAALFTGAVGRKVWFVGQPHDEVFFEPMKLIEDPVAIERVALDEAEGIVCCGPFDPHAHPDEMRPQLEAAKARGLPLLCANPDVVVDRGESREWCAGALADLYEHMGGRSLYFGKPHAPIYDLARRRLTALEKDIPDARILCVGDGIATDVKGALGEDLDSIFIAGGLAAAETKTEKDPDPDALHAYLQREKIAPTYAMGKLR